MRAWLLALVTGVLVISQVPWLPPAAVGRLALALGLGGSLCRRPGLRLVAGLLLGAGLGICHGQQLLERRLPEHCERRPLQVSGVIQNLPRVTATPDLGRLQRFEFRPDRVSPAACGTPRTVLLSYQGEARLTPGERWRFEVLLRRPWGLVNPGSFNMQAWYAQTGIDAVGSVRRAAPALRLAVAEGAWHHRLRQSLSAKIVTAVGDTPAGAILRALTVADRSGLDYSLWSLFQQFGISHLLVISGLHIGLLAACGLGLGTLLTRGLVLAGHSRHQLAVVGPLLALLLASCYTALAGFTLATSRAWFMLACFLLATLCGRPGLSWNNLLLAAALLLCLNPLAALGAGFWLSFGSVACLLWLALWRPRRSRAGQWLGTHVYMCLAMLPLGSWWFGGVSQVAALANALLVPLVGFFVVPLALLGALLGSLDAAWAGPVWRLAAWPLRLLVPAAQEIATKHPQWLYSDMMPTGVTVVLALVVLALAVVPLTAAVRVLLPLLLLPLLLPAAAHRVAEEGAVHIVALDVGQGTAVLLYDAQKVLLYDTGGGMVGSADLATTVVLPFMRSRGLRHIDSLVISHGDADHSAGLASVLGSVPVGQLLAAPDVETDSPVVACRAGMAWQWSSRIQFQLLAPATGEQLSANGGSCVLRARIGPVSLLLPGDIDSDRERELVRYWRSALRSELALAPHHGSGTSSSWAWLKAVRPGAVVYTHGRANRFGHPAAEVRQRHRQLGIHSHSTAAEGAVEWIVTSRGELVTISHRQRWPRFWER